MLAEHFTPWPSWRMGNIVHEVTNYLQVKDLDYSPTKRVVMMQARTCNPPISHSKVEHFTSRPPSHLVTLPFHSFSDEEITSVYLVKKDCRCWARSCDLESHRPARSHGAIEPSDCSDIFRDLDCCSSSSPLLMNVLSPSSSIVSLELWGG